MGVCLCKWQYSLRIKWSYKAVWETEGVVTMGTKAPEACRYLSEGFGLSLTMVLGDLSRASPNLRGAVRPQLTSGCRKYKKVPPVLWPEGLYPPRF